MPKSPAPAALDVQDLETATHYDPGRPLVSPDDARGWLDRHGRLDVSSCPPLAFQVSAWRERSPTMDSPAPAEDEAFMEIASAVHDADQRVLLQRCAAIEPVVHPLFHHALIAAGIECIGERSYRVPYRHYPGARHKTDRYVRAALEIVPSACLATVASHKARLATAEARAGYVTKEFETLRSELGSAVDAPTIMAPDGEPQARVDAVLSASSMGLNLKLCTVHGGCIADRGPLDLWRLPTHSRKRRRMFIDDVVEAAWRARRAGFLIEDPDGLLVAMEDLVREGSVARPVPGKPGLAYLIDGDPDRDKPPGLRRQVTAERALEVVGRAHARGTAAYAHPAVEDVARMTNAPELDDELLKPPQRPVAGAHFATRIGIVNASARGTGKTVITLRQMRRSAAHTDWMRAVVIVLERNVAQWAGRTTARVVQGEGAGEIGEYFGEALVLRLQGVRGIADQILRADAKAGKQPLIVVGTYEQLRLCYRDLRALGYHELVLDEPHKRMARPSSQTGQAAWALRDRCVKTAVLTGTPVSRGSVDLHTLVALVREDREMLSDLEGLKDVDHLDAEAFWRAARAYGPCVQRLTREDMEEYLPKVTPYHQQLSPRPAERSLIEYAEERLLELYGYMLEQVQQAKRRGGSSAKLEEAERQLRAIPLQVYQGAIAAKIVSLDPEAAYEYNSAPIKALRASGLVEQALKRTRRESEQPPVLECGPEHYRSLEQAEHAELRRARRVPTRRLVCGMTLREAALEGEQVLVFCEELGPLRLLHEFLTNPLRLPASYPDRDAIAREAGFTPVGAELFTGAQGDRLDDLRESFCAGEIPLLLCSEVGEEGHNLQVASQVWHYDLPWVQPPFEQRTGRGDRIGAAHDALAVVIPFMKGAIEERQLERLSTRIAVAHSLLDGPKGKRLADSETARHLAGLVKETADRDDSSFLMRVVDDMYEQRRPARRTSVAA